VTDRETPDRKATEREPTGREAEDDEVTRLLEALAAKEQPRTGWLLRGVRQPESVADHSWGTAYLCAIHAGPAGVDSGRAVAMAVIHDLAEAVTGDIPNRGASPEHETAHDTTDSGQDAGGHGTGDALAEHGSKAQAERAALSELVGELPGKAEVEGLWEEYAAGATPTARFVRDMNLIDMCLQAYRYAQAERANPSDLWEFFESTAPRIATPFARSLYNRLRARYRDAYGPRGEGA